MRVATALVVAPALLWLLFAGPPWAFLGMLAAVVMIASMELMAMALPGDRTLQVWGGLLALGYYSVVVWGASVTAMNGLLVSALSIGIVATLLVGLARSQIVLRSSAGLGWLVAGPVYVGMTVAALGRLYRMPDGPQWVLLSLLLAWLGDTAAYFVGRSIGKTPLYPAVSPTKTREGALGGLAGSVLGAAIAYTLKLPALSLFEVVGLGLVVGGLGQTGDLCESLIKRSFGVKDSGSIVPGHGGILDRIDAVLFTAVALWGYLEWVRPLVRF
jgi:phosphatidate cytidylyltransferase